MDDRDVVVGADHDATGSTRERRGAALYDLIVMSWAIGGVVLLLELVWPAAASVPLLVLWVLLVLVEGATGSSPGKLVTGLRVVREDGHRPNVWQVALRKPWVATLWLPLVSAEAGRWATAGALVILLAMLISIERSDDRRGFHDRLSGTHVEFVGVRRSARLAVVISTALLVLLTLIVASATAPVEAI